MAKAEFTAREIVATLTATRDMLVHYAQALALDSRTARDLARSCTDTPVVTSNRECASMLTVKAVPS